MLLPLPSADVGGLSQTVRPRREKLLLGCHLLHKLCVPLSERMFSGVFRPSRADTLLLVSRKCTSQRLDSTHFARKRTPAVSVPLVSIVIASCSRPRQTRSRNRHSRSTEPATMFHARGGPLGSCTQQLLWTVLSSFRPGSVSNGHA